MIFIRDKIVLQRSRIWGQVDGKINVIGET